MPTGPPVHTTMLRLSFADCDPAGIIYYGSWFVAMERALSEWFFGHGVRFDTMMADFGAAAVTRATWCEYLAPTFVYDPVRLELYITDIGRSSYALGFVMTRTTDGVRVAQSGITCVCVDRAGLPVPLPVAFRATLESGQLDPA